MKPYNKFGDIFHHKWGFYVNNHKWRPLRYFHKFGIAQTPEYQ